MSPGGSTPNSRRSRPELPPSSVTVTTAVNVVCRSPMPRCLRVGAESLEDGREPRASADRHNAGRGSTRRLRVDIECRRRVKRQRHPQLGGSNAGTGFMKRRERNQHASDELRRFSVVRLVAVPAVPEEVATRTSKSLPTR